MVIKKSSYERGFKHESVYKSYTRDLNNNVNQSNGKMKASSSYKMLNKVDIQQWSQLNFKHIGEDRLPKVGAQLTKGEPELCIYDTLKHKIKGLILKILKALE